MKVSSLKLVLFSIAALMASVALYARQSSAATTSSIDVTAVSSVQSQSTQFVFSGSGQITTSNGTNTGTFTITIPASSTSTRDKAKTCETYMMLLLSNPTKYQVQFTLAVDPQTVDGTAYDFVLGSVSDMICTLLPHS